MRLSTTTGGISEKLGYKEAVRIIAEAGFDAYDMNMSKIHLDDSPLKGDDYMTYIKELKAYADEKGISCNQAHAPFPTALNGNEEYNKMTFDMIVRSMECAAYLGAEIIVVHPIKEISSSVPKGFSETPVESQEKLFAINMDFYRKLIPYCERFGIKVALENMWYRNPYWRDAIIPATCGLSEEFRKYIDELNSEWLVACLDVGHCLLCGEKPEMAVRNLGNKRLFALHVHDVSGREDSHVLPYLMNVNWDEFLKALKDIGYTGDFTFEAHNFLKNCPVDFIGEAVSYMCKTGRYMVNLLKK